MKPSQFCERCVQMCRPLGKECYKIIMKRGVAVLFTALICSLLMCVLVCRICHGTWCRSGRRALGEGGGDGTYFGRSGECSSVSNMVRSFWKISFFFLLFSGLTLSLLFLQPIYFDRCVCVSSASCINSNRNWGLCLLCGWGVQLLSRCSVPVVLGRDRPFRYRLCNSYG